MKRIIALASAFLLLSLALFSCSGKPAAEDDKYAGITLDLEALSAAIAEDGDGTAFSDELVELSREVVSASYGFTNASELVVYAGGGATSEEIIAAKATDADALLSEIKARISSRTKDFADYNAAEVPKLENALLLKRGDYVFCVVAVSTERAQAVIDAYCDAALNGENATV